MGMFQEFDKSSNQQEDDQPTRFARLLESSLRKHNLVKRSPNIRKWAAAFRQLSKSIPEQRVEQVLTWYIAHLGEEFLPVALSATAFKSKFQQITKAMDRDPSSIQVDAGLQILVERIKRQGIPLGLDQDLPAIVQKSIENYTIFTRQMKELIPRLLSREKKLKRTNDNKPVGNWPVSDRREYFLQRKLRLVVEHVLNKYMGAANHFVVVWLTNIFSRLRSDYFITSPMNHVFDPSAERFRRMGAQWVYEFCLDSKLWFRILEELTHGS